MRPGSLCASILLSSFRGGPRCALLSVVLTLHAVPFAMLGLLPQSTTPKLALNIPASLTDIPDKRYEETLYKSSRPRDVACMSTTLPI